MHLFFAKKHTCYENLVNIAKRKIQINFFSQIHSYAVILGHYDSWTQPTLILLYVCFDRFAGSIFISRMAQGIEIQ